MWILVYLYNIHICVGADGYAVKRGVSFVDIHTYIEVGAVCVLYNIRELLYIFTTYIYKRRQRLRRRRWNHATGGDIQSA